MHLTANPAWSFQGRSQEKFNDANPGPGAYNPGITKFENSPNFRIGTGSRSTFVVKNTPGPGNYNIKSSFSGSTSTRIGTSKRPPLNDTIQTPGPGTYEIRSCAIEGPQYSMPGRKSTRSGNNSPGPGHYNQSINDVNTKERAPSYRIGSGSRTERPGSAYVPGPGTYTSSTKNPGPSWGFGTQSRDNLLFKLDIPGPGTYSIPISLSQKGISITGRKIEAAADNFPGPGSYNPPTERQTSPSWSMGKTSRSDFSNLKRSVPGPGTYSPKKADGKVGIAFGTSNRPPLADINDTPGPGEYTVKPKSETPAYSMRPKTATSRGDNMPGPGQYNPSASCTQFKWTIGKEQKDMDFGGSKGKLVPGPGVYNISKGLGGPKWSFGTSSRGHSRKASNPGPGAYNIFSSISNLPSYATHNR